MKWGVKRLQTSVQIMSDKLNNESNDNTNSDSLLATMEIIKALTIAYFRILKASLKTQNNENIIAKSIATEGFEFIL